MAQPRRNRAWRVEAPVLAWSGDGMIPARLEMPCPEPRDSDTLRRALRRSETQQLRAAYLIAAAGHDLRQPLQIHRHGARRLARSPLTARQLNG